MKFSIIHLKYCFLFFVFIFFWENSFGTSDSLSIVPKRTFNNYQLDSYKTNKEFIYNQNENQSEYFGGFLESLINKLDAIMKFKDPKKVKTIVSNTIEVILWCLAIGALVLLIHSIAKNGAFGLIERKKKSLKISFKELEDNVIETNWGEQINYAIANCQYNVAVRFLFLELLQAMDHSKLIKWNPSKSIRDYQRELEQQYRLEFYALARYYQYSWFGDVQIDEAHFLKLKKEYSEFKALANVA